MKLFALLPMLLAVSLPVSGQSTYTVKRIIFKNPGTFTQQQLEAAAQVHPGASLSSRTLGEAAQRLVDTGYFDNVQAAFDGTGAVFTLTPTNLDAMLHTGFENFVWLTHDQIENAIRAKLPLFCDRLTENTAPVDTVDAALTEALAAQSIVAKVTHEAVEPTLAHPQRTLEFRIESPIIRVANIKLAGVTSDLKPLVQKSVNATARTLYNDGLSGRLTAEGILAPLLDAGYADAALADIMLDPATAPDGSIALVISATLLPGDVYHVSHLAFDGTPLVTPQLFATTQKLHDGDFAIRNQLFASLLPIDVAYRRQGYMDVVVNAAPSLDRVAHTVAYTITVTPGEPYRIKDLKPTGLDPVAQAEFDRGWLMQPGALYNPEYITNFIKNNSSLVHLVAYTFAYKAYADPNTHTVDLLLTFYKGR